MRRRRRRRQYCRREFFKLFCTERFKWYSSMKWGIMDVSLSRRLFSPLLLLLWSRRLRAPLEMCVVDVYQRISSSSKLFFLAAKSHRLADLVIIQPRPTISYRIVLLLCDLIKLKLNQRVVIEAKMSIVFSFLTQTLTHSLLSFFLFVHINRKFQAVLCWVGRSVGWIHEWIT